MAGRITQQPKRVSFCIATALLLVALSPLAASAQDVVTYFENKCAGCHTIGGGHRTGPDLKNVSERQDRQWLIDFIVDPTAVLSSGDPYAQKLLAEFRNVPMTKYEGLTPGLAEELLDLIDRESQLEESRFKGVQISTEPFTEADRVLGRKLFMGTVPLENGGASCISCHSIQGLSMLGGGRLGNDLTNVFERHGDRIALSGWLFSPAAEAMQPIFNPKAHPLTSDEIHALVAYFEGVAGERAAPVSVFRVSFLLLGLLGATIGLFVLDYIWKKRFHAVRRELVKTHRR